MHQLWLIPLLPFAGFLINGLLGKRLSKNVVSAVAVGSVLLSFLWVVRTLMGAGDLEAPYIEKYYTWMASGNFSVSVDFMVDRLSAVMLLVVVISAAWRANRALHRARTGWSSPEIPRSTAVS